MDKNKSKYFNTAIKMDEALLSLLEKKEFSYITAKEICKAASVNRSTFYLHYENTSELLQETVRYILDKHFSYYGIEKNDVVPRLQTADRKELIFVTREYLIPYLTFVKENRRIFKITLRHFKIMNMDVVHDKMFRYIFDPILARFRVSENERPYVIKFYLSGVFAIVMEWLDGDCKDDMEFIIKMIKDCVLGARDVHD